MALFSKQKFYCNCCGKEMLIEWNKRIGFDYIVCSMECNEKIQIKISKSNMGIEYNEEQ
jgi:transcription elongation factor Elf1